MHKLAFYANTPDGTHCFQAACKMILKAFLPDREFSWDELDQLSAKQPGMATWPQTMLIELASMGFEVFMAEGFDAMAFIDRGEAYLRDLLGDEVANWQIANSNILAEQQAYRAAFNAKVRIENRIPQLREIANLLHEGFLVICNVNARALNHQDGYAGHFVVIYGVDDTSVALHDPGLPPLEGRRSDRETFEKAWAYPSSAAQNLIAVKYKHNA